MTEPDSTGRSRQHRYYEEACDPEFEINRPHHCGRLYEFLISHKLATAASLLGVRLHGRRVLELCCGSGMISEGLARRGAWVTGVDLAPAAIARAKERARRYGFSAQFFVSDAEVLPFPDRSFDIATVHDGLHHLDDPYRAVREMARVAREGVLIMEPARALLTRWAVLLGVAQEVEEAGNHVHRLAAREVATCLRQEGFEQVTWRRTLMYYPHRPSSWFRWFDAVPAYSLFRVGFWGANLVLGRWGNKLALGATRSEG